MPQAQWSLEAKADLIDVAYYLGVEQGKPLTADKIVDGALELANTIAGQPFLGQACSDLGEGYRIFPYKKRWIIIYRPIDDGIYIIRFINGSRDYDKLF